MKEIIIEILSNYKERLELLEGLTGAKSVKQRTECEVIIPLLEKELNKISKNKTKMALWRK